MLVIIQNEFFLNYHQKKLKNKKWKVAFPIGKSQKEKKKTKGSYNWETKLIISILFLIDISCWQSNSKKFVVNETLSLTNFGMVHAQSRLSTEMPACTFSKELVQFNQRILAIKRARRTSFSSYTVKRWLSSNRYKEIRTQALRHLKSGRKSAKSLVFYVDSKRNSSR